MTTDANIRYRPDGSIDTAFYMDRARTLRSRHAHDLLGLTPEPTRARPPLLGRLAALAR